MAEASDSGVAGSKRLYSIEHQGIGGALTPDINQSIIDLYRSFSFGNIVAFVGSGASASLGHCRWNELAERLAKAVFEGICAAENRNPEEAAEIFDRIIGPDVAAGRKALLEFKQKALRQPIADPADGYGQLCVDILIALVEKKEQHLDTFDILATTANAYRAALETARLRAGKKDKGRTDGKEKEEEIIRAHVSSYYRKEFYLRTSQILPVDSIRPKRRFALSVEKRIDALMSSIECQPEKPPNGTTTPKNIERLIPPDYASGIALIVALAGKSDGFAHRYASDAVDLISSPRPEVDILGCLRNEWKIARFATLNFDHEIERMLERGDYPFYSLTPKPENDAGRTGEDEPPFAQSRLGEKARTVDLNERNVAELMLLAADCPSGATQVLHLHGSMTHPDDMIVTDGDYNRRYFSSNAVNDVLSDGQELFFRGNAIVFVGVGMSEDELLRAARIMSQSTELRNRPVYAFMDSKSEAKDNALRIKLYERYGIHTLFYGTSLKDDRHIEVGQYRHHRLVNQARQATADWDVADIERLQPLCSEIKFLKEISAFIDSDEDVLSKNGEALMADVARILKCDTKRRAANDKSTVVQWPRLLLTHWHNEVFILICSLLEQKELRKAHGAALKTAIGGLESAIQARALEDGLLLFAKKAMDWKKRWEAAPDRFRECPWTISEQSWVEEDGQCVAHNISIQHKDSPGRKNVDRRLMNGVLRDPHGEDELRRILRETDPVTIYRSKTGSGKGIIATQFADKKGKHPGKIRVAISFGQSCSRDSCFDLIDRVIGQATQFIREAKDKNIEIEILLLQADITMTRSQKHPRLAEWDIFFRRLVEHSAPSIRIILLCEYFETVEYLKRITAKGQAFVHGHLNPIRGDGPAGNGEAAAIEATADRAFSCDQRTKFHKILKRCESIWLASYLNAVYVEIGSICENDTDAAERHIEAMVDRIEYALDVTQDPRQCVIAVVDAAMLQLEKAVYAQNKFEERLTQVVAHAILKHLFAFGGPVEDAVFGFCPEIGRIITEEYPAGSKSRSYSRVKSAIRWLQKMDLITTLHSAFDQRTRYGLHGPMRNYLAVKKGLPFSVVLGREQTAITLLPIIDEEIVPLKSEDYDFIWNALDGLLVGYTGNQSQPSARPARIRAAFMLLRGSMRIGTVLRSHKRHAESGSPVSNPLNRYFKSLLAIREAVIRSSDARKLSGKAAYVSVLSEREWIWLFNEMGVVKLLLGHVNDATAFFETALKFETRRIEMRRGYEWFGEKEEASGKDVFGPKPTLTKLRILLNLAVSEIERGAFNRAKRILASESANLEAMKSLFETKKVAGRDEAGYDDADANGDEKQTSVHREIRILVLVAGLIRARLDFLSGASGEAMLWLVKNEKAMIKEAVHGLTGWYYLIRADIEMNGKNTDQLKQYLATARAETEASGRSDLILSVMLAESQFELQQQRNRTSATIYHHLTRIHEIRRDAKRLGMSRILVSASLNRARLYMSLREYRSARHDLLSAISLSTSNGLSIKRVSGLIELAALVGLLSGRLRGEAGDIAEAACNEAERIGYKMAAMRATELQIILREHGSIEEWAIGLARAGMAGNGGARA